MLDLAPVRPVHQPDPRPRPRPGRRSTAPATRCLDYPLTDELDVRNFRRGLAELIRLHEAAGAEQIVSGGRKAPDLGARRRSRRLHRRGHRPLARAPRVRGSSPPTRWAAAGWAPTRRPASPTRCGELHDTPGVWIGDASAFPTASGVNPMVTIMALARRTAGAIAAA